MSILNRNSRFLRRFRARTASMVIAIIFLVAAWNRIFHRTIPSDNIPQEIFTSLDVGDYEESIANAYFTSINSNRHQNCLLFRHRYPIVNGRDGDMDLAFTITVKSDIRRLSRILRMIYRENNYYCVHVDLNVSTAFEASVRGVAKCFGSNVQLVPFSSRVTTNRYQENALKAQLACAKQALERNTKWKYLINISEDQLPLRTNLELIAALKALNGSNLVEAFSADRFKVRFRGRKLPLNATWYTGTMHGAYLREFIQEAVLGKRAAPVRKMLLEHKVFPQAEEIFFAVLAHNKQFRMPGVCLTAPTPAHETKLGYLGNFIIWSDYQIHCPTRYHQLVCVLGNKHLQMLKSAPHLFATKFLPDFEPEAYTEMERWYFDRIRAQLGKATKSQLSFDPTVYSSLTCSRLHL